MSKDTPAGEVNKEQDDWRKYYTLPFKYKDKQITDAQGRLVLKLPGWVIITNIEPKQVKKILNAIGKEVEDCFNKNV